MFSVLDETCPPGYHYLQKACSTGRGGGLSVIYCDELDLSPLPLPELSSFECPGCLSTLPILTVDPQSAISQHLHCFPDSVSQQEVEDIIRRMKPSTCCALDPFPTALVKTNISIISPLITTVINHSIQAGYVPPALKTAITRPTLKKTPP